MERLYDTNRKMTWNKVFNSRTIKIGDTTTLMELPPPKIQALSLALVNAQGAIKGAPKDGLNPHLKNRYSTRASLLEVIKPILLENGLSFSQHVLYGEDGRVIMEGKLIHKDGHIALYYMPLVLPSVVDMQKLGSAITYASRYQLKLVFGIVDGDDDDDDGHAAKQGTNGAAAASPRMTTREQYDRLLASMDKAGMVINVGPHPILYAKYIEIMTEIKDKAEKDK